MNPEEIRLVQAQRLFTLGFGGEVRTVDQYLQAIPPVPETLFEDADPNSLIIRLADPRRRLALACHLAGVQIVGQEDEVEVWNNKYEDSDEPFWFRFFGSRSSVGRKPADCRAKFTTSGRLAGTAMIGVMMWAHDKVGFLELGGVVNLPGTVLRVKRHFCAAMTFQPRMTRPELVFYRDDNLVGLDGTGSFLLG